MHDFAAYVSSNLKLRNIILRQTVRGIPFILDEVATQLKESGATVIITQPKLAENALNAVKQCPSTKVLMVAY